MKWTKEMIDRFDINDQIDALTTVQDFTSKITTYRSRGEEIDRKIKKLTKKINFLRSGIPKKFLIVAAILVFLVFEFLFRLIFAIVVCALVFAFYVSFFADNKMSKREEIAEKLFGKDYANLIKEQEEINYELNILFSTDEGYNANLLLPQEFLYPEKINALINILKSRTATNIRDAIDVYNMNNPN